MNAYLKAVEEGTTGEYHNKRGRKMSQKQAELDRFDIPPKEPAPQPEPPKAPEPLASVPEMPAPKPDIIQPESSKRKFRKMEERIFMPESATYFQWTEKDLETSTHRFVLFPSKRIKDLLWKISIRKSDGLMECDCPGFPKVEPYKPAFICSHCKKFRWVCVLKPYGGTAAVSLAARLSISEEAMDAMKKKVVDLIAETPSTCDELEVITGLIHQTCSPVIRALFKAGWLEDSGDRRPTRRNRAAIVWQIS